MSVRNLNCSLQSECMYRIFVLQQEIFTYLPLTFSTATNTPVVKPKRVKGESKLRVHQTGCARSEGYYKIPMVEKALYLKSALRKLNILQQNNAAKKTQV